MLTFISSFSYGTFVFIYVNKLRHELINIQEASSTYTFKKMRENDTLLTWFKHLGVV